MTAGVGSEGRTGRSLDRLVAGIGRSALLAGDERRLRREDANISGWSIGLHVEHLWKTERQLLGWTRKVLDDPGAAPGQGGPTPVGIGVLVSGWIPRGRAAAPEASLPDPPGADLVDRLNELHSLAEGLAPRSTDLHASDCTLEHPVLGHLSPAQWLRFLEIHHRHHEKIIRDIE